MVEPLIPLTPPPCAVLEDLGLWIDPLEALDRLRGRRHPVLLLSGLRGHPASRFSILGCDPAVVVSSCGGETTLTWEGSSGERSEKTGPRDFFTLLRALAPGGAVQRPVSGLPFAGGAIGYLGYGLRRSIESLPATRPDPLGMPDAWFGLYDATVIFDHSEGRVALLSVGLGARDEEERGARARERLRRMRAELLGSDGRRAARGSGGRPGPRRAVLLTGRDEYLTRIDRALDYIARGDIYQVNLSHRIECPFEEDPLSLFAELSRRNPAPFAAYLDTGPFQVISASPERFVALHGRTATSSPIKGTRPRGSISAEDERLAHELLGSPKDRAENVMIADLVRNDLGRVCQAGSVRTDRLCALESFATVHHLVSTISGRLRPDRDRIDLLTALFPGGSMTGAPKVRAMEVIDELEGEERGVYSGSIGYLSLDGGMDFNIVIRTVVCSRGKASLRVGGAIVADSDPVLEYRETLDKARAMLEVLRVGAAET
jgi:para-aminobenzoate synthetase component I